MSRGEKEVLFEDDDYILYLIKSKLACDYGEWGWGCGYVGIKNSNHSLYNKHYNDGETYEIDVHGGITFSEEENGFWVFGFDTYHYKDNLLNCPKDYVIKETLRLYKQVKERE